LLQRETLRNIRAAFTTTVYAFLSPGRPSAARDFFCLAFLCVSERREKANRTISVVAYIP
jgi:hypothetical protein